MLFMGRHPFAGRYLGSGEMPIPRAIKECRFAYGARRTAVQMEKPPGRQPYPSSKTKLGSCSSVLSLER